MRVARSRRFEFVSISLLLVTIVASSGCDGEDSGDGEGSADGGDGDGDGDGDLSACDFDDQVTWDGATYANGGPGHETLECDPFVEGWLLYEDESIFPAGPPLGLLVTAQWGKVPTQSFPESVSIRVFRADTPMQEGSGLPFDGVDSTLVALEAESDEAFRDCRAMVGEATVTRLPDEGEYVEGTYSVTEWDDSSDSECPTPATGTFSFDRFN